MLDKKIRIDVKNLDKLIDNQEFEAMLRSMTLSKTSGMNKELTALKEKKKENGVIDAKAVIASTEDEMLGWLLFSREDSSCCMTYKFRSEQGVLVQVYTRPDLRKNGVARKLMLKARRLAGNKHLCVVPWDDNSERFFKKNRDLKLKSLTDWVDLSI